MARLELEKAEIIPRVEVIKYEPRLQQKKIQVGSHSIAEDESELKNL